MFFIAGLSEHANPGNANEHDEHVPRSGGRGGLQPIVAFLLLVVSLVVRPGATSSFLLLPVRHLLLEAMHLLLGAIMFDIEF